MQTSETLANHLEQLFFGKNWTGSSFREALKDLSWEKATQSYKGCNSIAVLLYHVVYYIRVQKKVLEGGPLSGNDQESFQAPKVHNEMEWQKLQEELLQDVKGMVTLLNSFSEEKLPKAFADSSYGSYLRNFIGVLEHSHYHLGQIVLLKKLISQS